MDRLIVNLFIRLYPFAHPVVRSLVLSLAC